MNELTREKHDYRVVTALLVGGIIGAGVTMLLAPRAAAEIKDRAAGSAKDLGDALSERYRGARTRVADAVDGLTRKGQGLRDGVIDTVVRGAHGVEVGAQDVQRFANEAKTQKG